MSYKTLHIVLNSFINDSRVIKECKSINEKLFININVYALHEQGLKTYEESNHFTIHRFALKTRGWSKKKSVQLIKYFECFYSMFRKALVLKPDIIHAHDLHALPIGVAIARKLNIPIIYDAHEYETQVNGLIQGSLWQRGLSILERYLIKKVNKVVTVSESIANEYVRLYNIEKPILILNCPPYQLVKKNNLFCEEFNIPNEHLIFLYQGGLSSGRGLLQMLEAFKELNDQTKHLILMGYGELEATIKEYAHENTNIHYKAAVKPDDLLNWTSSADVGFSTIENTGLSDYYCLPNKLFEYLMAGLPVIVSNLYELKRTVRNYNLGWVLEEDNTAEQIRAVIKGIKKDDLTSFQTSISNAIKEFNWEKQEEQLLKLYKELLNFSTD